MYPGDWDTIANVSNFVAGAKGPFFAFAGTNILHPPYATNEHWFSVAQAANVTVPEWPQLTDMHPCDLQGGCKPTQAYVHTFEGM